MNVCTVLVGPVAEEASVAYNQGRWRGVRDERCENSRGAAPRHLRGVSPGDQGVVVGQGETYEGAVADLESAIKFHLNTFGDETLVVDPPILEMRFSERTTRHRRLPIGIGIRRGISRCAEEIGIE